MQKLSNTKIFLKLFVFTDIVFTFAVMDTIKKQNRSKYGFGTLQEGESLFVEPLDVESMKNSLRAFNRSHRTNIVVEPTGELVDGKIKCLVLSI